MRGQRQATGPTHGIASVRAGAVPHSSRVMAQRALGALRRALRGGVPVYYRINGGKTPVRVDIEALANDIKCCARNPKRSAQVGSILTRKRGADRVYVTPYQVKAIRGWARDQRTWEAREACN